MSAIHVFFLFLGFAWLLAFAYATYFAVPKGNWDHFTVKFTTTFTRALRGTKGQRVGYWIGPAIYLLFASTVGGLFVYGAVAIGVKFNRLYLAHSIASEEAIA